jgi:uncharacterized protein
MSGNYSIPISGMKEGKHTYDFEIDDKFFELFEESEVREGKLSVVVNAEKRSSHIDMGISISGNVNISCDRCLGIFPYSLSCGNRLLVKFGKTIEETDPDIISIPKDENELDLSQYFYEYILLALPIQRIHPADSNGKSTCDPEMIGKLKEHISNEEDKNDPRWDELKKLMNKN